ncbi:MAG: hypothetical protein R3325_14300 [Thermoanaerobaculia bacterium]|nr:hypothetical protein [Thermoanaerobaculia bacterium]
MRISPAALASLLPLLLASLGRAEPSVPEGQMPASECPAWVRTTYQMESEIERLGLDLGDAYASLMACVERDASLMRPIIPVGWCDNILKIHCSGLDLLAEIGEASIDRCEQVLAASLGIDPAQHTAWRTCGRDAVFDRYSLEGEPSDEPACRAALLESCGTRVEARSADEGDPDAPTFADCCFAEALDPERGEDGPCGAIDAGFSRGPCLDRPVCVNRRSGEWLSCAE